MSPIPGLLWAYSKPKSSFLEADYNAWYTDHHIHHVVDAGLSNLAIRYKNVSPDAKWPYLAVFRLPDVAKLQDKKFMGSIPTTHELLPEEMAWSDAMEVDIRPFTLLQKFEGQIPKEGTRGKALPTVMVEPSEGGEAEFDDAIQPIPILLRYMYLTDEKWYRKQHLDMLSMVPGYRRSTRYEIAAESADSLIVWFLF